MNSANQKQPIRLLLYDQEALLRESLSRLLAAHDGILVAGQCDQAVRALEILRAGAVDVALVDFNLAMAANGAFLASARRAGYKGRFLLIAGTADASTAASALKCGAAGVFLKSQAAERLVRAITLVANGAVWLDRDSIEFLAERVLHPADSRERSILSDRERQVLLGILGGLTNRLIGQNLGLQESTVKTLVQQLFQRTGVRTRSQLVRVALEGSLGAAPEFAQRLPGSRSA